MDIYGGKKRFDNTCSLVMKVGKNRAWDANLTLSICCSEQPLAKQLLDAALSQVFSKIQERMSKEI